VKTFELESWNLYIASIMKQWLYIILGAGAGGACRYTISILTSGLMTTSGTLIANYIGCFGIGFMWLLLESSQIDRTLVLGISVGFLGSLTTFSTYQLELFRMIKDQIYLEALLYFTVSNLGGFLLVILGYYSARLMITAN
tara:strand:+ start:809 stop:1231 length:423 start_codon:yes stop_codon:yes gene_type:complete